MTFLNRQTHFTAAIGRKILSGLILGAFLNFIIIALQPFDTSQFEAENKILLLSGYGFLVAVVFIVQGCLENPFYYRKGKFWLVKDEIVSTAVFCLFSGTVLYAYNRSVVNDGTEYTLSSYWLFMRVTVLCMIPVFIPPMLYLRKKLGEKIIPPSPTSILISGENKKENLRIEKQDLLFIKAVENYIEICFVDTHKKVISKTFRQRLSTVSEQLPFLAQCHRSYLVNTGAVKEIIGNSQSAKLVFTVGDKEVPLSKTYYKEIKKALA